MMTTAGSKVSVISGDDVTRAWIRPGKRRSKGCRIDGTEVVDAVMGEDAGERGKDCTLPRHLALAAERTAGPGVRPAQHRQDLDADTGEPLVPCDRSGGKAAQAQ